MLVFVEGYPGISVNNILKDIESSNVTYSEFLFQSYFRESNRKQFLLDVETFKNELDMYFVLLVLNTRRVKGARFDKREMKRVVNFFNWGFSLMNVKKAKIDLNVIGHNGTVDRINRLVKE